MRVGVPNPAGVLQSGSTPEEVEARLAAIDHALQRLEAGTYWSCEECGTPFEEADLRADPAASLCGEHAGKAPMGPAGGAA